MTLGWLLTNVAWGLTLVITSFVGGVMLNQCAKRREAEHAAVLQHAARRKLSMRTRGRSRGLEHDEAREQYGLASGLVERGKAIVSVLNLIRFGDDLCARLMAAGTLSGCWGKVVFWDPKFNRRISLLSRVERASRSPPSV